MADYLAWKAGTGAYFGEADPALEKFAPVAADQSTYEHIETSYFGFSIPEENINGNIYFWFHPEFGIASGGVIIQQGWTTEPARGEYCDWRHFMPIPDDLTDCTYANGITVKMIRPLEEFTASFTDPATDSALDLHMEAVMPAAFRPSGGHLSQAMRTSGTLRLRGKEYRIDGYTTRDRSWGDPRSERSYDIPPISWAVPVFSEDLAFHIMGFDTPERVPGWEERYPSTRNGANLLWGYVWRGGQLLGVKSCEKVTTRDPDGRPRGMTLDIVDEQDRTHRLVGTIKGGTTFCPWPNNITFICLVEWRYGEKVGYGDLQESIYPQFFRNDGSLTTGE